MNEFVLFEIQPSATTLNTSEILHVTKLCHPFFHFDKYSSLGYVSNSTNSCTTILVHKSVFSGSSEISKYLYYSTYMCNIGEDGGGLSE